MVKYLTQILKWILISIVSLILLFLLFIAFNIQPIDHTPYKERASYPTMQNNLSQMDSRPELPKGPIHVGYSVVNITPDHPTAIAGVGLHKPAFTDVHDSIFVRAITFTNGSEEAAIVSFDMLIVPPQLTAAIETRLPELGLRMDQLFLSATHTHSSIGNWGEHLGGTLYTGKYDQQLIDFLADRAITSLKTARSNYRKGEIRSGTIPMTGLLFNRLADEAGDIDSLLHILEVRGEDSVRLVLLSFTGHPTSLSNSNTRLSRDYPGYLVDRLESNGYTMAMFVAGAMGSHGCKKEGSGFESAERIGNQLADAVLDASFILTRNSDSVIQTVRVPLVLPELQFKVSENWRLRPWIYRTVLGEYPTYLNGLRIGNQILLGTPCDFSGELTQPFYFYADQHHQSIMITSFNGAYIGYITRDAHYNIDHYETRLMNWYGPGNGAYISECLMEISRTLIDR